ncbi:hypothetical protein CARUB_v10001840mg [Capsella rubella]|uniref:Nucleoplasmin-like domain-containing protein n=1 Tax=Capsella rubella TaxID=81985 RepID=R0FCD5_9BRAS|nr:hypothetical protein CARUB_v10001840mg [Capsella rubella]
MEFWGVEVKSGAPLKVTPEEDNLIHISQATLDCKGKMTEPVLLTVTVDNTKLVIGTLSQDKFPQISFDLVFEKEFELSHNCTRGNVHFIGYRSPNIDQGEDFSDSEEEEEEAPEAVPAVVPANGNAKAAVVKADSKPKAKPAEVAPESEDDEDDSDEEDESDDDDDSEKGMDVDEDDSDDEDDSEDEEEEETPKKAEPVNKKRPIESASKTPVSGKKAKPAATPLKTEEKKKGGHTATPS